VVEEDPILKMWGLGRELWKDVDLDEYVAELRRDYGAAPNSIHPSVQEAYRPASKRLTRKRSRGSSPSLVI
jgi:hypothetical protein